MNGDCQSQEPVSGSVNAMERLCVALSQLAIAVRIIALDTGTVLATVPMVRGVWGAALHGLDPKAYASVFDGTAKPHARPPQYILRAVATDPIYAPAIEWISIGDALNHDPGLMRAWDVASGMGLGPRRERFRIKAIFPVGPEGQADTASLAPQPWPLSQAIWPIPGDPATAPCRIVFQVPVRLMRDKRLITDPTLADIAVGALRRLAAYLPQETMKDWRGLQAVLADQARTIPALPWQGAPLDLVRYSGRQHDVVDMHGVAGHLDLPSGPGPFWPLLASAQWLHIGKATIVGLGQVVIHPLA